MAARAKKVATNLSLRADLVAEAKALALNLSEVVDAAIEVAVREAREVAWLADNREAIDQYNDFVTTQGLFSDGRRRF
ncbi:MAG TPA: type II toxin-antitoxin system CcdA family antitoxin [Kofleriaceae bacterium]|nr:type II toxin-antitoxin system CcdA family antitoxin [Kofleriaceae bacterium]